MNPPSPDAGNAERVKDTVQLLTEAGALLGMLWAFVARVLAPYHEKRRRALAQTIKEVMVPVLAPIHADHDLLLEIALDNRERHDETNELLDFLGFTSDRRTDDTRRDEVTEMVTTLAERRRVRRRSTDT